MKIRTSLLGDLKKTKQSSLITLIPGSKITFCAETLNGTNTGSKESAMSDDFRRATDWQTLRNSGPT